MYQGEDEDALKNILVGDFHVNDLTPLPEPNELMCRMRLDLNGILEVTTVEKQTGKSKQVTVANALRAKNPEEIAAGRQRIQQLYERRDDEPYSPEVLDTTALEEQTLAAAAAADTPGGKTATIDAAPVSADRDSTALLERSRRLLEKMHEDDREESVNLNERIQSALESRDFEELKEASKALRELLFFVEGQAG